MSTELGECQYDDWKRAVCCLGHKSGHWVQLQQLYINHVLFTGVTVSWEIACTSSFLGFDEVSELMTGKTVEIFQN